MTGDDDATRDDENDDQVQNDDQVENEKSDADTATDESVDEDRDPGPSVAKAPAIEEPEEVDEALLISRLEALVFVAPEPISVRRLARILSTPGKKLRELLGKLGELYENRGVILEEVAGGFQFRTHPDHAAVIRHVFKLRPIRLSRPAIETLAIVAYRQPATRAEVEQIRGVDSGGVLKFLFEKDLVRVLGRREGPGRPVIYGTAPAFLELFGLKSLDDLPPLHEYSDLWDEHKEIVEIETEAIGESDAPDGETPGDEAPSGETPSDHGGAEEPAGEAPAGEAPGDEQTGDEPGEDADDGTDDNDTDDNDTDDDDTDDDDDDDGEDEEDETE